MNDLKRVAANALALSLVARIDEADEEVRRICDEHRFPLDDLLNARRRVIQMPGREATMNQRDIMKRGLSSGVIIQDCDPVVDHPRRTLRS